ncbi:hypothetical protein GBAR_LOCUS24875 [Geodia barretti]|uniref:Uncharacterized protein n=1 Tax=Geodia barretti TaxID=519541 RepID=A0AA35TCG7_GEOBA|nr:hypothetical protein GBAR_LOCUS24875 [Geodia barretti]
MFVQQHDVCTADGCVYGNDNSPWLRLMCVQKININT